MFAQDSALNARKQKVLKAVVQEHVDSAEPVGSESLVMHHDFGVRSATIRNEMAELSEMGYLKQPHTSAGRVPSDMGYRFYVDWLMDPMALPRREALKLQEDLAATPPVVDQVISHTCRILTGLTKYTAIATQPSTEDAVIQHIGLSRISDSKLLMVIALSDGRVEHRMLNAGRKIPDSELQRTGNVLAAEFTGKTISELGKRDEKQIADLGTEARKIIGEVVGALSLLQDDIWIEGTSYILRQPEFRDPGKFDNVVALLDERRNLYQLLSRIVLGPDVTIVIGSENPYSEMQDTSFVGARYWIGDRAAGTIGVFGPTRMDYSRAIAAVEVMARNLGELLTQLSLE
jgi:heat-inducible transcriptional repressor